MKYLGTPHLLTKMEVLTFILYPTSFSPRVYVMDARSLESKGAAVIRLSILGPNVEMRFHFMAHLKGTHYFFFLIK